MLNVLLVSPHFAPTNAPDMQRVRLLLPHFEKYGVRVTILSVAPERVDFPQDPWLEAQIPASCEVVRVKALGAPWKKLPGLGSISTRSFVHLRKAGNRLLEAESFDLIYFSTTQFGVHLLGPFWKSRFGVPFLMDFQDPWVNDYYRNHPDIVPPGGRLKFAAADWFNRQAEPRVMQECLGITSVSPAYPAALELRYPRLNFLAWSPRSSRSDPGIPVLIAPFPVEFEELSAVRHSGVEQTLFDPQDGQKHWLYAGRCGDYMETSLSAIFDAIRQLRQRNPRSFDALRIHFVGTEYQAEPNRVSLVERLSRQYGLNDIVAEHPARIPYSEVLQCLEEADLLLVPGSDDPGYSASKIFPYLISNTPVLGVFHEDSSVVEISQNAGGSLILPFHSHSRPHDISDRILHHFNGAPDSIDIPLKREALQPYSAEFQAGCFSEFFHACLSALPSRSPDLALTS